MTEQTAAPAGEAFLRRLQAEADPPGFHRDLKTWVDDSSGTARAFREMDGQPGVSANEVDALVQKWSGCWCGTQVSHDHDPRVRDCPQHGSDDCRHVAAGIVVDLRAVLSTRPEGSTPALAAPAIETPLRPGTLVYDITGGPGDPADVGTVYSVQPGGYGVIWTGDLTPTFIDTDEVAPVTLGNEAVR